MTKSNLEELSHCRKKKPKKNNAKTVEWVGLEWECVDVHYSEKLMTKYP
jgi:hypothetical protein